MATTAGTETIVVTTEERTWRVNIETPQGIDPTVQAYRETIRTDQSGNVISRDQMRVRVDRSLSQAIAAGDQVTLASGMTISAAEMAEAIAAFIDLWRQQDMEPRDATA